MTRTAGKSSAPRAPLQGRANARRLGTPTVFKPEEAGAGFRLR